MKVRSSTRATSPGSERARKRARPQLGIERLERPGLDERLAELLELLARPVEPVDAVRLRQRRDLLDPCEQLRVRRRRCRGLDHVRRPSFAPVSWSVVVERAHPTNAKSAPRSANGQSTAGAAAGEDAQHNDRYRSGGAQNGSSTPLGDARVHMLARRDAR